MNNRFFIDNSDHNSPQFYLLSHALDFHARFGGQIWNIDAQNSTHVENAILYRYFGSGEITIDQALAEAQNYERKVYGA